MAASDETARPEVGDILFVIRKFAHPRRRRRSFGPFIGAPHSQFTSTLRAARCAQRTDDGACADDFLARSSDELSLAKGDRVELVERDDEFGDGWYLGKQLANGSSGLFPAGSFPALRSA